ncbi:DUF4070 domain-containing protein [candidate division KSB1 bacterium]|nr:DUF4070 domain-containing protein [candidate division KSB1 bacterium]
MVPKLRDGWQIIVELCLTPFERTNLCQKYKPSRKKAFRFHFNHIGALFKSVLFLGIIGRERIHYWNLFFWSLFRHPRLFPLAITFAVYGFHFRKVFENY